MLKCKNCGYVFEFYGESRYAECPDCGYTNEYFVYLNDGSKEMFEEVDDY